MDKNRNYKIISAGAIPIKDDGSYFTSTEVESALQEIGSTMSTITNITNPLIFKGSIALASEFPTSADVETGWFYTVTADVTDNDATKTNTGDSFSENDEIVWNGTAWVVIGNTSASTETDPVVGAVNGIVKADGAGNISAAVANTDYQDVLAEGPFVDGDKTALDANTSARHAPVTVTDSSEIDFTLDGQDITASLKSGSIDESKLDTSVNASLDLADSALQETDKATGAEIDNGTDDAKYATAKALADSDYQQIKVTATEPSSPTTGDLWLDIS